jgi:hypothetical protein
MLRYILNKSKFLMSSLKPLFKSKSTAAKVFFIASIVFAGPVSFLLYDFYVNWSNSSSETIAWYLAFAYDMMGAWGGVFIALTCSALCFSIGYMLHKRRKMYHWS